MYNSFGVIQNNFQKWLTVKHRVHVFLPQTLHCWFYLLPFLSLLRSEQPRRTECTVYLVRTARNTWHCAAGDVIIVLPLPYGSAACFLLRSQQVQNKVTTRFNKLIYILFKDVQCTFCLIQGFGVSRNFYLHIYNSQTAMLKRQEGQQSLALPLWTLRTRVKYILT